MRIILKSNISEEKEWSGAAIASFICGIIGILFFPIIPAIILGHIALHNIKKNRMKGKVFAIIGLVSGYTFFAYVGLVILILCIGSNSKPYKPGYPKELLALQRQIINTNPPPVHKVKYTYNPPILKSTKQQPENLYDNIMDIEIAVNKENRGNFIYGVGTAGLKYLVRESGIDDHMPKYTLGSETLTKMIEDAGYTPKTNYSIAGRGGLIDYLWSMAYY